MLDDLEWLFALLGRLCQMPATFFAWASPCADGQPLRIFAPDGNLPARNIDFTEGTPRHLDPGLEGMIDE